ncbi:MAG TPA: ABC transporter permease [Bryobacteraceae bacterium]|jgi:ABC-type dipeptide/oligopeptide/nickel transport system permease subunit|nr:ABC transporter permease [Bryobacteraceae bacterium]
MKTLRQFVWGILILVFAASLMAGLLAPAPYGQQFRDSTNAGPSRRFPLGTDELGRDRLSRLLYGSRVSLLLAPAAALLSTFIAALIGGLAGYLGGWWERLIMRFIDLSLSLPWLFLLLTVRALLPLNVSPVASVSITFALLGLLGWAGPARVVRSGVRSLTSSGFVLQAKACGCRGSRLLVMQVLPNLKPILQAQFWISVPVFILAEANLGLLGLGVSEPLPSWGNLLRGLENYGAVRSNPWTLAPVLLLVIVMGSLHLVFPGEDYYS